MRQSEPPIVLFQDYRLCFLLVALILYATLSSPTPDNPSWVEVAIAGLLLGSLGASGFFQGLKNILSHKKTSSWNIAGYGLLCYGLIVPTLLALYHAVSFQVFIRDIIAFGFLCVPIFLVPFLSHSTTRQNLFAKLIIFIGLAFALRVVFLDFSFFTKADELLYLANSPLVLLAALYCVLCLGDKISNLKSLYDVKWLVIYGALALLPMLAMYIDFQRASFLAIGLAAFGFGGLMFFKTPVKTILPAGLLLILLVMFLPYFQIVLESIVTKTSKVGLNMRYQEAMAVWSVVSYNPFSLLFGLGWGAEFSSPAVGMLNVGYTHSLLTYIFLKAGLIALGLTLFYLFFIFQKAIKLIFVNSVWGNALIWPLVIPVILYASYKSLDFGLIMTLIIVMDIKIKNKVS